MFLRVMNTSYLVCIILKDKNMRTRLFCFSIDNEYVMYLSLFESDIQYNSTCFAVICNIAIPILQLLYIYMFLSHLYFAVN